MTPESMRHAHCDVLVVGAGPTGLTAAMQLAAQGVDVVIIDKADARSSMSKAIAVQAGTLELLETVFGAALAQEMVEAGVPSRSIDMHIEDRPSFPVDTTLVPSRYNFLLMLAQSETERIFEEWLSRQSVKVLRKHELESFEMDEVGVRAQIKLPDGHISELEARYLIGCDGASSRVREQLGVDFVGGSYQGFFLLADLKVDWPYEPGSVRGFLTAHGSAVFFPLKGDHLYRLFIIPNHRLASTSTEIAFEELRTESRSYLPDTVRLSDPLWVSTFRIHHRVASTFQVGRAFLAGDAAHIHSPAGAQGMNMGIHEAINLGHKLKLVLKDQSNPSLLKSYEKERRPMALTVQRVTDFAFTRITASESIGVRFLRRVVLPRVLGRHLVQRQMMKAMSEIRQSREQIAAMGKS